MISDPRCAYMDKYVGPLLTRLCISVSHETSVVSDAIPAGIAHGVCIQTILPPSTLQEDRDCSGGVSRWQAQEMKSDHFKSTGKRLFRCAGRSVVAERLQRYQNAQEWPRTGGRLPRLVRSTVRKRGFVFEVATAADSTCMRVPSNRGFRASCSVHERCFR